MAKNTQKQKITVQERQDEIFRRMSVEKKLSLLDEFFKFGKELKNLNDCRSQAKI